MRPSGHSCWWLHRKGLANSTSTKTEENVAELPRLESFSEVGTLLFQNPEPSVARLRHAGLSTLSISSVLFDYRGELLLQNSACRTKGIRILYWMPWRGCPGPLYMQK